jgi:bacterioferritin-associated ferredoxin
MDLKVEFKFKGSRSRNMIVCICKRVSHRQVEAAIDSGAETVEEVGKACGAGTGCGACREQISEFIEARCGSCEHSRLKVLSPYLMPGRAA